MVKSGNQQVHQAKRRKRVKESHTPTRNHVKYVLKLGLSIDEIF